LASRSFYPTQLHILHIAKNAIGGMASFDIAKNTLNTIGLDCPIWLLGIGGKR
jgi:hypothetical protein